MTFEQKIWLQALPQLEFEVATASYQGFISNIEPIALEGDNFILQSPDKFKCQTLNTRYYNTISNAIHAASGKKYELVFITPDEAEKYKPTANTDLPAITLNSKYTFDSFVIGSSNRFANAAAIAVAKNPGKSYNPLFIYGGVGLGKTHLMHAIGNEISAANPSTRIMYVTSEKFTNELINAIRSDRNEEFRAKYRNIDVLMVDDIQFISNKEGTQEEFFHTFNALHDAQKQIVISSDKQPKEIPTLEERLRSRFEWGLIADVQPPDYETRVAILQKKANIDDLSVPIEVLHFIANRVESNIRELEGSLTRVIAFCSLSNKVMNEDSAHEALKDFLVEEKKQVISLKFIQQVVADYYKIPLSDLSSKKRNREIVFPRQIAMYLTREMTDLSLPRIGADFGGRDHTTVMHACEKVFTEMSNDPRLRTSVDDIIKRIKS